MTTVAPTANEDHQGPMAAMYGTGIGPNDVTRCLGLGMFFIYLLILLLLLSDIDPAHDKPHRPTMDSHAGQRWPTTTNADQYTLTADEDHQGPMAAMYGTGIGPNDVTRCLGLGMFFIYLLILLLLLSDIDLVLDFRQSSVIANSLSSRVQGFSKLRAKEGLQRLRSLL